MQVQEIWRYPVKSMQGERVDTTEITEQGIVGDRGWALFDTESGFHLTARRQPELLFASAKAVVNDKEVRVVIHLPDGTEAEDDDALSDWLGRRVELRGATPDIGGRFQSQADENETGEWFDWEGPNGSFHDSTRSKISLVSASAFREWDPRRFRINVVVDADGDTELVGSSVDLGGAVATVTKRIDRCVMTTRPQPEHESGPAIERDLEVLRTINTENETFLGIGAMIDVPGRLQVGDKITPR